MSKSAMNERIVCVLCAHGLNRNIQTHHCQAIALFSVSFFFPSNNSLVFFILPFVPLRCLSKLLALVPCRARRKLKRGLKRKPLGLLKKLRKAKKEAPEGVSFVLSDVLSVSWATWKELHGHGRLPMKAFTLTAQSPSFCVLVYCFVLVWWVFLSFFLSFFFSFFLSFFLGVLFVVNVCRRSPPPSRHICVT